MSDFFHPCTYYLKMLVTNDFTYCSYDIVHNVFLPSIEILESITPRYMSGFEILSYLSLNSFCIPLMDLPGSADMQITSST